MTFTRRLATVVGLVLSGLVPGALSTTTEAQTTSASVSGAVQDAQGGVQPGVTVTLTSRTQGHSQTAVTDGQGRFVFPIVRPDTYSLQVALAGCKTLERTNLGSARPGTPVNLEVDILAKYVEKLVRH